MEFVSSTLKRLTKRKNMENTKNLHLIALKANPFDAEEWMKVKAVIKDITGREVQTICPTGEAMIFLAHANFDELNKELKDVIFGSTNMLICALSKPYTTIGFAPTLGNLKRALDQK